MRLPVADKRQHTDTHRLCATASRCKSNDKHKPLFLMMENSRDYKILFYLFYLFLFVCSCRCSFTASACISVARVIFLFTAFPYRHVVIHVRVSGLCAGIFIATVFSHSFSCCSILHIWFWVSQINQDDFFSPPLSPSLFPSLRSPLQMPVRILTDTNLETEKIERKKCERSVGKRISRHTFCVHIRRAPRIQKHIQNRYIASLCRLCQRTNDIRVILQHSIDGAAAPTDVVMAVVIVVDIACLPRAHVCVWASERAL